MTLPEEMNGRAAVIDAPTSRHLEKDGAEFKRDVVSKDATQPKSTTPLLLDLIPLHAAGDLDAKGRPVGKAPLHSGWRREAALTESGGHGAPCAREESWSAPSGRPARGGCRPA